MTMVIMALAIDLTVIVSRALFLVFSKNYLISHSFQSVRKSKTERQ